MNALTDSFNPQDPNAVGWWNPPQIIIEASENPAKHLESFEKILDDPRLFQTFIRHKGCETLAETLEKLVAGTAPDDKRREIAFKILTKRFSGFSRDMDVFMLLHLNFQGKRAVEIIRHEPLERQVDLLLFMTVGHTGDDALDWAMDVIEAAPPGKQDQILLQKEAIKCLAPEQSERLIKLLQTKNWLHKERLFDLIKKSVASNSVTKQEPKFSCEEEREAHYEALNAHYGLLEEIEKIAHQINKIITVTPFQDRGPMEDGPEKMN